MHPDTQKFTKKYLDSQLEPSDKKHEQRSFPLGEKLYFSTEWEFKWKEKKTTFKVPQVELRKKRYMYIHDKCSSKFVLLKRQYHLLLCIYNIVKFKKKNNLNQI